MKTKNQRIGVAVVMALPLWLLLAGCNQNNSPSTETSTNTAAAAAPDNSAVNARDRNNANLTPGDQGNSDADRATTQKIRQALISGTNNVSGTNNFSVTARNVKIITDGGKVTLRGPVNTAEEKTAIESIAKNIAGAANVDDQLEVKTNP